MLSKIQIEIDDVMVRYCGQNCHFLDKTYLEVGKGYRCSLFSLQLNYDILVKRPERLLRCIRAASD
jgi:hypothetical protein